MLSQAGHKPFIINSLRGFLDHEKQPQKLAALTANAVILSDDCPLAPAVGALSLSLRILVNGPKPEETFGTDVGTHAAYMIRTGISRSG